MKNIKYLIIFNIIFVLCGNIAFADDIKPVYEQYYLDKIKDSQIGYTFVSQKEQQNADKKIIITNRHSEMRFKRLGFTIKMIQDIKYVEDDAGNPVSIVANTESQGESVNIQGKFLSNDKIQVTSIINGVAKNEEINLKKPVLFPSAIDKLFKDSNHDKIEYSTIDPSNDLRIINVKAKKIGSEALFNEYLNGNYTKYKVSIDLLPGIDDYQWYNNNGMMVDEKTSLLGMEQVAVDKDKIADRVDNFDIFYQGLIPVDSHIPNPFSLDKITYKIEIQNGESKDIFVSDDCQKIFQIRENTAYLKIKNQPEPAGKFNYPVNFKGYTEFLKSGPFIISNDEQIINQAKILAGSETNAYKIVKSMEKWVFDDITRKDLSINFANSTEVMRTKEGDCTEHSVLLAALLRAAGIPSKVVVGLIYTDTPKDAFVYHMWVKAYIGKWINLDPSFPSENFSPAHIALAESSLNNLSDKTDMILEIVKSFTNLKINILDYTSLSNNIIGVKLSANDPQNASVIDINTASNINNAESPIKIVSLKDESELPSLSAELKKKYIEEYSKSGLYDFSKGDIDQAVNDFEKVYKMIPYNDDLSGIKLASKLASLGLFNLTESQLKKIHDLQIWGMQINNIKNIFYPKQLLSSENELILANVCSKTDFQNDPDEAISLINSNSKFSKNDYALYLMAKAYMAKNQTTNALNELNKAILINPVNLNYKLELARVYIKKNDLNKARKELDYILRQNITDKKFLDQVNTELYWLLFKDNRKDALKSKYYYAKYYVAKEKYKEAADILTDLVKNKYEDISVYELLGDINFHLNQTDTAILNYNKALKLDKKSIAAYIGIGNVKMQEKQYKDALDEYLKAEKIMPENPDIMLAIADAYKFLSQEELAYNYYNKVIAINNNNCQANYNIGIMYFNSGNSDKAEVYLKKALSVNPFCPESWLGLAKLELDRKNYFLAKTYLDAVSYMNQENYPQYYYYSGLIDKNNEDFSSAKENFQKAINLKSDYEEAIQELEKLK